MLKDQESVGSLTDQTSECRYSADREEYMLLSLKAIATNATRNVEMTFQVSEMIFLLVCLYINSTYVGNISTSMCHFSLKTFFILFVLESNRHCVKAIFLSIQQNSQKCIFILKNFCTRWNITYTLTHVNREATCIWEYKFIVRVQLSVTTAVAA